MGIIPTGRGQRVVVVRSIGGLSADVDLAPVDRDNGCSANQTVDEGGVGVLENLLDAGTELVGRLCPVVVFQGDHEDRLDCCSATGGIRKTHTYEWDSCR